MPGTVTTFSRSYGLVNTGKDNPKFAGTISVTPSGLRVNYSPSLPPGTNIDVVIVSSINSAREFVGYDVTNESETGFDISTLENATVKYEVNIY